MFDPEDYNHIWEDDEAALLEQRFQLAKKRFEEGCNEAYELLCQASPELFIRETNKSQTKEALNKMLWFFIEQEEFEKCAKIKSVYIQAFGKSPNPVPPPHHNSF
jgi:hypothetical protein